jgi:hypothetical protein
MTSARMTSSPRTSAGSPAAIPHVPPAGRIPASGLLAPGRPRARLGSSRGGSTSRCARWRGAATATSGATTPTAFPGIGQGSDSVGARPHGSPAGPRPRSRASGGAREPLGPPAPIELAARDGAVCRGRFGGSARVRQPRDTGDLAVAGLGPPSSSIGGCQHCSWNRPSPLPGSHRGGDRPPVGASRVPLSAWGITGDAVDGPSATPPVSPERPTEGLDRPRWTNPPLPHRSVLGVLVLCQYMNSEGRRRRWRLAVAGLGAPSRLRSSPRRA